MDGGSGDITTVWEGLAQGGGRIVYLVMDGVGGLRDPARGRSALEAAVTPELDRLAARSACGALELVGPGITPGSGPGHLALFGYDPLRWRIGRGVLSALGIDFDLRPGDVAARVNLATVDEEGRVTDRRAGRIPTGEARRLCAKIRDAPDLDLDGELFLEPVAGHRAVLVLRGQGLSGDLEDTDPQRTGVEPRPVRARSPDAEATASLVRDFLGQAGRALAGEARANALLLRGFQRHDPLPTLAERFGLRGLCIAGYPMYRGLSRLLGMEVAEVGSEPADAVEALERRWGDAHDLCFLHVKGTDEAGEDGDLDAKVAVIEQVDALLPRVLALGPDVLVVTADHSTPAVMAAHSWHPVPVMLHADHARVDAVERFDEYRCGAGSLGLRPGAHLLGLALAHAHRLRKLGA